MVEILFSVDASRAKFKFNNLNLKIPKAADLGAKKVASFAATAYYQSAFTAKIRPFRGRFYKTFSKQANAPKRLSGGGYGVDVSNLKTARGNYAIQLDRMRTHKVFLKRGKAITDWAKSRGFSGRFITVHAHPYIDRADAMIIRNAKHIVEGELNKVVMRYD